MKALYNYRIQVESAVAASTAAQNAFKASTLQVSTPPTASDGVYKTVLANKKVFVIQMVANTLINPGLLGAGEFITPPARRTNTVHGRIELMLFANGLSAKVYSSYTAEIYYIVCE